MTERVRDGASVLLQLLLWGVDGVRALIDERRT